MILGMSVFQTAGRMGGLEGSDGPITGESLLESIDTIAEMGFRHMELLMDPLMVALGDEQLTALMDRVGEVGEQRGFTFSVHAPFWWIDIATPAERMREASVQTVLDTIELTLPLRPTHFVIHPLNRAIPSKFESSKAPTAVKSEAFERYLASAERSVNEIAGSVENRREICVENLPHEASHQWTFDLAERTDTSICFDSGHSYLHTLEVDEGLKRYYPRILAIHGHNILVKKTGGAKECRMEDHHSLRTGLMDNEKLISDLVANHYQGYFVVEVQSYADALDSSNYLRELKLL